MIKITKRDKSKEKEYKFEDLKPGTVFKWTNNEVSLKLENNKCIHLTDCDSDAWFILSDGSIERNNKITEVYGIIDEIIVKEIV
uniref:Uncharacterized protein n=1 Tax=viral metagenome TaxID=1070528 RepID=A0A6M3J0K7_9ZZZZ